MYIPNILFFQTKQLYANLKHFSTYFSLNYNNDLNLKSLKNTIITLREKNIINSIQKHNKSGFHHGINTSNPEIIELKTTFLIQNILNMNETKLQRIKNNLINKSPLNIEKIKKKINYIQYILNQFTLQNFQIPASDLPNFYNEIIISYKSQINSLTKHLKNSSFPKNLKIYSTQLMTPPTTPANRLTRQITVIEDTPVRMEQTVKTFYKRYLYGYILQLM